MGRRQLRNRKKGGGLNANERGGPIEPNLPPPNRGQQNRTDRGDEGVYVRGPNAEKRADPIEPNLPPPNRKDEGVYVELKPENQNRFWKNLHKLSPAARLHSAGKEWFVRRRGKKRLNNDTKKAGHQAARGAWASWAAAKDRTPWPGDDGAEYSYVGRSVGRSAEETAAYDLLGVTPDATWDEIKTKYRGMARKMHPDKNPDNEEATANFQKLSEAYKVLEDKLAPSAQMGGGKKNKRNTRRKNTRRKNTRRKNTRRKNKTNKIRQRKRTRRR